MCLGKHAEITRNAHLLEIINRIVPGISLARFILAMGPGEIVAALLQRGLTYVNVGPCIESLKSNEALLDNCRRKTGRAGH
jgi:hypothetical protein